MCKQKPANYNELYWREAGYPTNEEVLVCYRDKNTITKHEHPGRQSDIAYWDGDDWLIWDSSDLLLVVTEFVIGWMPKPEPPNI